ncbi:M17 family metallopeptidase [Burkholderiaceae bacterium UC74_6]
MTVQLKKAVSNPKGSIPITVVDRAAFLALEAKLPAPTRNWLAAVGFKGKPDSHALVPGADGKLGQVFAGVAGPNHAFALSTLPYALPEGSYHLANEADGGLQLDAEAAALSWELGAYRFDLYRKPGRAPAELLLTDSGLAERGLAQAAVIAATRDLVNTPAEHMGPEELSKAVALVAKQHGAKFRQIVGDELLKKNFPAIHAVGRASHRAPRLIELNWGSDKHPRLTLVGKGVCFDTGGLDIKGAEGMRQMKKDMGGAANALGLAALVMAFKLPVRLQLLIPAVENAIAGNAYRPGDIFKTRNGTQIEIGNTDAEGRVILCDALSYACEHKPELLIDMATLTGAARVALGPQLPALFARHVDEARDLMDLGLKMDDPMWHMPIWQPYKAGIESTLGDIVNTGKSPMAGAINAALFLDHFVPLSQDWMHIDLFAWNSESRPGRPAGGEAQTVRALLTYLEQRFSA